MLSHTFCYKLVTDLLLETVYMHSYTDEPYADLFSRL